MPKVEKRRPNDKELEKLGVKSWGKWTSPTEDFDYEYDDREVFYVLEGEAEIDAGDQKVKFGPGDLVTCNPPFKCRWHVIKQIKKHYRFG
jgi:uncharacterized cupin superfamily protein